MKESFQINFSERITINYKLQLKIPLLTDVITVEFVTAFIPAVSKYDLSDFEIATTHEISTIYFLIKNG